MKKRRGRPRGLRVTTCSCGKHVTATAGSKRATCSSCGRSVRIGKRRPREKSVFEGYLETS